MSNWRTVIKDFSNTVAMRDAQTGVAMDNLAPNLTSAERDQLIKYLQMSRDERAHFLGKAFANPAISAHLLRVLAYLLTA